MLNMGKITRKKATDTAGLPPGENPEVPRESGLQNPKPKTTRGATSNDILQAITATREALESNIDTIGAE